MIGFYFLDGENLYKDPKVKYAKSKTTKDVNSCFFNFTNQ
ncbi:hypothetical protein JCM19300_2159 [Algibacter lectus]|uniref:Uncharacterized protein n=1 Tax=Algibacter lectus TaxID=221126 RepID=A0A090VKP3_9FLAO|nr:hypothetical protein JCM19300_2159 [Algibacter lectus]